MEYKVCLRAKLPWIDSRRGHLQWFRDRVGEPASVEDEDDDDHHIYFSYRIDENYKRVEHDGPWFNPCEWEGDFGVELILSWSLDDPEFFSTSMEKLVDHFAHMRQVVGEDVEIKLHSYGWYNGGDEYIEW
jgi:hypothetical protein